MRLDEHGRPFADPRIERIAWITAVVGCVLFAIGACWGMAEPFGSGHFASTAARGVAAENMAEWHILAPVREYLLSPPTESQYYAHHPWGPFWLVGLAYKLFGRHDFVCRLPALLMSIACPPLLWAIGRGLWGPVAGALAAWGYAVLPISLCFAGFAGFEGPVIFASLLVTWTYVRLAQTWRLRWLVGSVLALLFAVNSDWEIFVFLGLVLGVLALGVLLPRGWFGNVDLRRFAQWWVLASGITLIGGVFWIALFKHYGHLEDLLGSHSVRSAGNEASLSEVLETRKHWIELMFTPLAIVIGKLAVFVFAIRLVLLRRVLDIFPLAMLAMSIFHYAHFKQGADVHIFWPQVFAPYFALSLAVLGGGFERALGWLLTRITRRELARLTAYVALGMFMLVPLVMIPDALSVLAYGQNTGFRFNEKGNPIRQDLDKAAALGWISARLEGRAVVELHRSMDYTWAQEWALHRPIQEASKIPESGNRAAARYLIADSRRLLANDQKSLAEHFQVTAVGPFWLVDHEAPPGPITGFALDAKKPSVLQRYFVAPVDPIYQIVADPFRTWELRDHFAQTPNPPPGATPQTADQRRIAHNVAVARGDLALAERLRQEIAQRLDRAIATPLDDGSELIGLERDELRREIWIYVRAAGPTKLPQSFQARATVEKKKPLSLIPADEIVRRIDGQLELDTTLWKKDYLYSIRVEHRSRLGRESYQGFFTARGGPALRPTRFADRMLLLVSAR